MYNDVDIISETYEDIDVVLYNYGISRIGKTANSSISTTCDLTPFRFDQPTNQQFIFRG